MPTKQWRKPAVAVDERTMTIEFDHTIVPAHDKEASARFFARVFGLAYKGATPPFASVRVNDRLTLDFRILHFAFHVSECAYARDKRARTPSPSGCLRHSNSGRSHHGLFR